MTATLVQVTAIVDRLIAETDSRLCNGPQDDLWNMMMEMAKVKPAESWKLAEKYQPLMHMIFSMAAIGMAQSFQRRLERIVADD
jgi:hypothetical protein